MITHYCTPLDGSGGNHVDDASAAAFTGIASNVAWLSGIDVAGGSGAVVALGDSITDGVTATVDGFTRYTDDLEQRLQAAGLDLGVINEGISGDGITESYGVPNAPDRFGRDVLDLTNVSAVIILLGTNDIGLGQSAQPIINGLADLANRAHAAGVRVIAGTLLPRWCGWPANVDATQAESIREQVNTFIRTSSEFDAVADFDAALRNTDPNYFPTPEPGLPCASNPNYDQYLAAAYDNDHTHPSNAGYAAMANAIDLATLLPAGGSATSEITWQGSSKCVDRDVASGRMQIWDCLGGSNQLWTLNSDATLTTGGVCAQTPDDAVVNVAPCTAASNQLWTRSGSSLVNQATGSCLDLSGGDSTNGRQLVLAGCDGDPNESFVGPG